jgi:hypothetical protein
MTQQPLGQRRTISGHSALNLLRDIAVALDGVVAPRVAGTQAIQELADKALQSALDGHDVRNWDSVEPEVRSELARRWLSLAAECNSFGDASMLSLPWGITDRAVRDMLMAQLMQTPPAQSAIAA